MSQAEDLEAIDRYIGGSHPRTAKAAKLRDEWIDWYTRLSWYERYMESDTLDKARNRRLDFNYANATSAAETAQVANVAKTGMTLEEAQGGVSRQKSSGKYTEDPEPLISTRLKVYLGLGAAIAVAGYAGKALYVDPWLSRIRKAL